MKDVTVVLNTKTTTQDFRNMNYQGNMTPKKDHDSLPVTNHKHGDLWFIQEIIRNSCFKEA